MLVEETEIELPANQRERFQTQGTSQEVLELLVRLSKTLSSECSFNEATGLIAETSAPNFPTNSVTTTRKLSERN